MPKDMRLWPFTDCELWVLTCAVQELHDSLRHANEEDVFQDTVAVAEALRGDLEAEYERRNIDNYKYEPRGE